MRKVISALSCLLLCVGLGAQDSSPKARKARLEREIEQINRQLSDNSARSRSALSELSLINKKVANRTEMLEDCDREIASYSSAIDAKQGEIDVLQRNLDTLSLRYSRLVKSAYKSRDARIWYMYILGSDNPSQAFRRYSYFKSLSANMKNQAVALQVAKDTLARQRARLEQLRAEARILRDERAREVEELNAEKARSQKVVDQLKKNRSRYENELALKRRQVSALNREMQRMVTSALKSAGGKKAKPVDYTLAKEFSRNKGKLPWPAEGPVTEHYGQRYHPVFTKVKLPFNNGINIALAPATPIKAVFDGVVKQIVVMPGYNECVLLQHGDYFTLYCKLKSCSVKAGDKVRTGQVVGVVDTINGETDLYFQVWHNQDPMDPEIWLR